MFRFIFVAIFLILYLILSIPVFFVEWVIGKFNPHARDISSLRIVQWGFKVILKMTGVEVTVIGEENGPAMLRKKKWKKFRFFPPGCVSYIVSSSTERIQRKD